VDLRIRGLRAVPASRKGSKVRLLGAVTRAARAARTSTFRLLVSLLTCKVARVCTAVSAGGRRGERWGREARTAAFDRRIGKTSVRRGESSLSSGIARREIRERRSRQFVEPLTVA